MKGRAPPLGTLLASADRATAHYVTDAPGCHDCPHWTRRGAAIGECHWNGRQDFLTSYAYACPGNPRHPTDGLPGEGEV